MGTDRAKAERFLARTPLSAFLVDTDGTILLANDGLVDILGFELDELVGHSALDFVHPDDVERAATNLVDAASRELPAPLRMAARVRCHTGEHLDLEIVGTNLLGVDGFDGVLVSLRHSSRVGAQGGRRGWFEAVLAQASDLIEIVDEDGRFLWVNGPVEDFLGLPAEALVGLTLRQVTNAEDQKDMATWWQYVLGRPGPTPPVLGKRRRPDGSVRHYEARADNLLDHPDVRAVVITIRDAEERIAAEEARQDLAANETRLRALGAHSHELVVLMGRNGRLLWAGAAMRRMLGRNPDEMFGMPISEIVHPDDLGRPGGLRDLARGPATHFERDYRVRHADGSWRVFDVRVADLRDEPTLGAFLVTARDVTDRAASEEANRRMAAAIDSSGAIAVVTDPAGRVLAWNHRAEELAAITPDEGTGRQLRIGGILPVERVPQVHRSLLDGETSTFDVTLTHPTDSATILSVTASPVIDASGTTTAFSFIGFDITAQRAVAAERDAHARRARALADLGQRALSGASLADVMEDACGLAAAAMDLAHVHVQLFDVDRGTLEVAAAVGTGAGSLPRSEPLDARPWISAVDDQHRPVVVEHFGHQPGGVPRSFEELGMLSGVLCTIDGGGTPIGWLNALDIRERRYDEAEVGFLQSIANVLATTVERNRVTEEMARRALHDELTDLPNRTLLLDRLSQGIARLERHPGLVGLLFIDLDRFKRVNDTMGHQAGDRILMATARRLREAVRAEDTVARAGGDEFLVLTEEAEVVDDVLALADRVALALAEPIELDGHRLHVTASIGVATSSGSTDPETLVRDADLAMYRAKQDGRDRIRVFDRTMRREAFSGMALEEALRSITVDGGLRVVYQPQVDLITGDIVGMEALARWDHPELGAVPPGEFVTVADDIGVLDDITCVVLQRACATAVELRGDLPHLTVAVNLTPRQLSRRRVVEMIDDLLGSSGLDPSALIVEVTESAALDDGGPKRVLADLRSRGIRVAIDDFGTGYSSLSRVTHLPVDEVKIDRSFIGGLTEELGRAAAVSAIVTLSRVLGLRLVAEGVEDEDQRQALLDLGCTEGQGWLFAGGLEADEIGPWARERTPPRTS